MTFKPASFLDEAVKEKNLLDIRIAIGSYISKNPSNITEIMAAKEYAEQRVANLMEDHNGENIELSREKWNEDYFAILQTKLMDNFSDKRFEHLLKVGEYLYSKKTPAQNVPAPQRKTPIVKGEADIKKLLLLGGSLLLLVVFLIIIFQKR
jgi:hypothetical protein